MNELLEKAKRDYPIGTKFRRMFDWKEDIVIKRVFAHYENIYTINDKFELVTIYHSDSNQWAEIIKEETMFKKGDYIVTLINDGYCGKANYCSKQRYNEEYLVPEIDTKGNTENGNGTFEFSDKSGWKWRFATKEEGEEYEKHGKPYNVTTFKNQSNMTQQEFNALRVGDFIGQYEILHKYKEFLIVRCEDGHDLFDLNKINKLGLKVQPKTFMGLEIKKYDNVPCEIGGNSLVYLAEVRIDDVLIRIFKDNQTLNHVPTSIRIL